MYLAVMLYSPSTSYVLLNVILLETMDRIGFDWDVAVEKTAFGITNLQLPPREIHIENPERKLYFAVNRKNSVELLRIYDNRQNPENLRFD